MSEIKVYGNGWFTVNDIPKEMIKRNSIVILDEINVLNNIEKNDDIDIIYIQAEPKIIFNYTDMIIKNACKCSAVYTYDTDVLEKCQNAKKYLWGTTWIPKEYYLNMDTSKKKFMISTIVGTKNINNACGHLFRQSIHQQQDVFLNNALKLIIYISSRQQPMLEQKHNNRILYDSKTELFDQFQYSIIIENDRQIDYFSEKLIDCLITKTIPIYFGCPNISDYFDTSYWIILDNTDINFLNEKIITIENNRYDNNYEKINNNYMKSIEYSSFTENLRKAV